MKLSCSEAWLLAWLAVLPAGLISGEPVLRQEIPSRFAPAEWIKRTVQPQLSAAGRYIILPEKGTVLVIDEPARVVAVANAMEKLEIPPPHIQLSVGLETGGHARATSGSGGARAPGPVHREGYLPFPSSYTAPRVPSRSGGGSAVLPAHPMGFRQRTVGQSLDVTLPVDLDASKALDVNSPNVEFSGFVSYGSPVVTAGTKSILPLASGLFNVADFEKVLEGNSTMPVSEISRVSTFLVVTPEIAGNLVKVHLLPRLVLEDARDGMKRTEEVLLKNLASQVLIPAGKAVRLAGFAGAPPEFNALFFAPKNAGEGLTRMVLKANVSPAEVPKTP